MGLKLGRLSVVFVAMLFALGSAALAAQAPVTPIGSETAVEVVRLMEVIEEKRCGIEEERVTELQSIAEKYREDLQEIAPKDMFESKFEYQTRKAREKSEVELQRAASINVVHRTYDDRLRQEVEPLIQRVEEQLSPSEDVVPHDAIKFHLETYDAESQLFHGILKIDSLIVPTDALIYFPMKRADARIFWGNRQSLVPRVRVSLDLWTLNVDLARFGLDDPDSGMTTRVFVVRWPPLVSLSPEGKASVISALKVSAENLAATIAADRTIYIEEAKGFRAEYNRLIREAKSVFVGDAVIQGLQEHEFAISDDNRDQAAYAVRTAAIGLQAYLNSFVASEGFMASAENLAATIAADRTIYIEEAKGFRAEYNRLIREAKSVFVGDAVIQGLQEHEFAISDDNRDQAAYAVRTAAIRLQAYLNSFVASEGFMASAENLAATIAADRTIYIEEAKGFRAEYNRLIREAKSVFVGDAVIQGLQEHEFAISDDNRDQAAYAVRTAAIGLQAYLNSFVASEGFMASAENLAATIAADRTIYIEEAKGFRAEYNRLIREAKSVFVGDAVIQGLQEHEFAIGGDNRDQMARAIADAAGILGRVVANISDVPLSLETTEKPSRGNGFDYLPYSGRFSEGARRFGKLRRGFSLDAVGENGWTDLHHAAIRNWPGLASALLDAGADPGAPTGGAAYHLNQRGYTPLHLAADSNALTIAADLVGRGAKVNAENDPILWIPLHYAARNNSQAVAELLIGQGADVHAQAGFGWMPLDVAIKYNAPEVAELLRHHEAQCSSYCY